MAFDSVMNTLERYGVTAPEGAVNVDLAPAELVEAALANAEGKLANNGSLVVETGKYTGRSPKDRFVDDPNDDHADHAWGNVNDPLSQAR